MKKYEFYIRTFDRLVSDDGVNTVPIDTKHEFYLCSEADEVIAEKERDFVLIEEELKSVEKRLAENERVILGFQDVYTNQTKWLAARDKTIERLKELVETVIRTASGPTAGYCSCELGDILADESGEKLDSILGTHADPPAMATQSSGSLASEGEKG